MSEDIDAINVLSKSFFEEIAEKGRFSTPGLGNAIILTDNDPTVSRGKKILRMYEDEAENFPDDPIVSVAMAQHLYRLGWLYYQAIVPRFINDKTSTVNAAANAEQTCYYMCKSFELCPIAGAALVVADVFRLGDFYATSLSWYDRAIQAASDADDKETATRARAQKLEMKSDGNISDPMLSRSRVFPTKTTSGLIISDQTPPTSGSSGSQPIPGSNPTSASVMTAFGGVGLTKWLAGLSGIFLGSLGIHKFVLGRTQAGWIMLAVTVIGGMFTHGLVAFAVGCFGIAEGIIYLRMPNAEFADIYLVGEKAWL